MQPELSKMVAATLSIAERQVARTLDLLEGGATIPFISRYRKEMTGGLDEVQIGEIKRVYDKLVETGKRKETILASIEGRCYTISCHAGPHNR